MTQAKRIKPKRKATSKSSKSKPELNLPWGLLLVVLCCGMVIGALLNGANKDDSSFGAGLRVMMNNKEVVSQEQSIAELIEQKSSEKEFDFYTLLTDMEKVMPDNLPEAQPSREYEKYDYFLQAASFKEPNDAENLRARLGLQGYQSTTQAREVEGEGTYYRVRLGPYLDKRKAKTVKNKLEKLGVKPFIYAVEK